MSANIAGAIREIPVIDVHEHHMPDTLLNPAVGLLQLLQESYAGWTQQRPYPLPNEKPVTLEASSRGRGTWEDVAAFVEGSGTNAFVRNIVHGLSELYDLGDNGITRENWEDLDARIREKHAQPGWVAQLMDRAGIARAISDPYSDPLMDVRKALGDRYFSVLRINALALGWHPESRDHNGHSAQDLFSRARLAPRTFDEYLEALPALLDLLPSLNKVGLKNALAYDRQVNFDDTDETLARSAWGKPSPTPAEKKAFGDVVVDRLCLLAGQRDIPVQMHLGTGLIRGSRPLEAAGLVERHPHTRFLLMHLAYPWTEELLGMAFVYRNVWIDLTWSWLLSPARFVGSLQEAIDVLPDESRMMLGGDAWHAEETYAAIGLARSLIASALEQCIDAGRFRFSDAERISRKIFHDNAEKFFRIG